MDETTMNTYETNTAPNALDFLGSYLKKEDVLNPQVVNITDVYQDELPGESRSKLVAILFPLYFQPALYLNIFKLLIGMHFLSQRSLRINYHHNPAIYAPPFKLILRSDIV